MNCFELNILDNLTGICLLICSFDYSTGIMLADSFHIVHVDGRDMVI